MTPLAAAPYWIALCQARLAAAAAQVSRADRSDALRHAFTDSTRESIPPFAWGVIAVFSAVVGLLVAVRMWLFVVERAHPRSSPMALFRWALRRGGVRALDRLILCRLVRRRADSRELEHPTAVLLSAQLYARERTHWMKASPGGLPGRWLDRRLERIGRRLFESGGAASG